MDFQPKVGRFGVREIWGQSYILHFTTKMSCGGGIHKKACLFKCGIRDAELKKKRRLVLKQLMAYRSFVQKITCRCPCPPAPVTTEPACR